MSSTRMPLEVAVFSASDAIQAFNRGARRVELNAPGSYDLGGLTPTVTEFIQCRVDIPVRVMIRPLGAPTSGPDFVYSAADFDAMKRSISSFKRSGVMNPIRGDGFVFGILRRVKPSDKYPEGYVVVDIERCTQLVKLAHPFPCVFHRAFDPIAAAGHYPEGLRDLGACGFEGVLTSGGRGSHANHLDTLDAMACHIKTHSQSLGRLQLIVGGGVRPKNAAAAVAKLGAHDNDAVWLHSACLTAGGPRAHVDSTVLDNLLASLELAQPD